MESVTADQTRRFDIDFRGKSLAVVVADDEIALYLEGVERKRRKGDVACAYAWTNVELHWEEHAFIEARWWPATGRVRITANGDPLIDDP